MSLFQKKSKSAPSNDKMDPKPTAAKSLPLAMSIQKQSKRKKLAYGGKAEADGNPGTPARKPDDSRPPKDQFMTGQHPVRPNATSSMIPMEGRPSIDEMQDVLSIAQQIMHRRKMAEGGMAGDEDSQMDPFAAMKKEMYANGGMVDLDMNDEESPNQYDIMNRKAANAHQYDDDQLSAQPMDSNEDGQPMEDEEDQSIVAKIRRKAKKV